jgi:WD40 repeat protein
MKAITAIALIAALAAAVPAAHAAFPGKNGRIAFERDLDECFNERINIYSVNPFDAMPYDFTIEKRRQASWAPDGARLAYYQDGTIANSKFDGTMFQAFSATLFDEDPTWSPDGTRLAWTGYDTVTSHIWAGDPDGGNAVQLTSGPAGDFEPTWSPDGSKIAFTSGRDGDLEIFTMNADGSGLMQVTSNVATDESPNWSPDGDRLAFARSLDIWTMRPDGTDPQQLTTGTTGDRAPAWSPDGAQIAFDRNGDIWTMTASGANPENLTPNSTFYCDTNPDWQPLPVNAYPRPRGASPMYLSLVPAYEPCAAPNTAHGAPLSFGSCAPPTQSSSQLMVGTKSVSSAVIAAKSGNPATTADEADVRLFVNVRDVRRRSDLSDFPGTLEGRLGLRITDRDNTPHPGGPGAGTVTEVPFPFAVPCAVTADATLGSSCAVHTTADAVLAGTAREGGKAIWALSQFEVRDTAGAPFLVQGLFVP